MAHSAPSYVHSLALLVALSLLSSFVLHNVAARNMQQMSSPEMATQQLSSPVKADQQQNLPVMATQQFNSPVKATKQLNTPEMAKQQFNSPVMANRVGMPAWMPPALYKPAMPLRFPAFQEPVVPPHFLPLLPFPGMPQMPSMPSLPAGPNYPSLPSVPPTPAAPSVPETPSDVPPAFPVPTARSENSSGAQMSP